MRLPDLRRLPPGDRGPALRIAAERVLASLDVVEAEPRLPGRDAAMARARRISVRKARLLRLAALAESFRIALQPAAIERAASHRKAPPMTTEPKSIALGNAILHAMKDAIEGGMSPQEAIDTGLTAVCSISVQVEGEYRTGAKLIIAGEGMVDGSPEGIAKRTKRPN